MSEIIQTYKKAESNKRCKKNSTKVDLTPMVDLGFLLITFFVFTTSISQPHVMVLAMPQDKNIKDSSETPEGKTLNLLPGNQDTIFYYSGTELNKIAATGYYSGGLRSVIMQKKEAVKVKYGGDSETIVLIKPTAASSYENLVNTLDEMQICGIKTYILMEPTIVELTTINE